MLLLGLGHRARHGKDSFARAIEDYYANVNAVAAAHLGSSYRPVIVQRLAFAGPLRVETNEWLKTNEGQSWLLGDPRTYVTNYDGGLLKVPDWVKPDPSGEVTSATPLGKHAKLLQWWGTEFRRENFGNDYWVSKFLESINQKADIVIATDMRFPNEVDAIKKLGGFTVNLWRRNADGSIFRDPTRPADHPSEIALDTLNYDYRLEHKEGDQAWLGEQAATLVHYLRARITKGK